MVKILRFTVVAHTHTHAPNSHNLAASNFCLFSKLKEALKGQHSSFDDKLEVVVLSLIRNKPDIFFMDRMKIEHLEKRQC